MVELVLARYKEDISWCNQIFGCKITVYNKFQGCNLLPNIGYEAHTYLHHIVANYDSLADVTVFSQASLHGHIQTEEFVTQLKMLRKFRYDSFFQTYFCAKDGSPHHFGLQIESFWKNLFGTDCPDYLEFHPFGIFSVPARVIRNKPLEFYQRAMQMTKSKSDACIMERLWKHIFDGFCQKIKLL
jgi:hypothetical protein